MIRRNEIRIGRTRVERRTRRLTLRGWTLQPEQSEAVEFGVGARLPDVLRSWRSPARTGILSRCRLVVDDSLLQYAVVPGLADARTLKDFRTAARLRCEALFGWAEDRWMVAVATPPTAGSVLVCAARRDDVAAWEEGWRQLQDGNPSLVPAAIDAIDQVRRGIPNEVQLAVLSGEVCVGFLVRGGDVKAVVQQRDSSCAEWDDETAARWLGVQAALAAPGRGAGATVILDLRDWSRGCVVREGRLQ
jgi:hypothetical protein